MELSELDHKACRLALQEAEEAGRRDEVPIGAVIVDPASGQVIAQDGNRTRERNDPTAHAEIMVIRAACQATGAQRIPEFDLYVTLEPCAMCAAAISFARIRRVIFAADDQKGGGILHGPKFFDQPTCHHRPMVVGPVNPGASRLLLQNFFQARR
jgi:tRNA(adenine34) deaminase